MHRTDIALKHPAGARRGLHAKQFVSELHDSGCTRDEAIEMLSMAFGVPWGAAQLFVVSHPAWAAQTAPTDSHDAARLVEHHGAPPYR